MMPMERRLRTPRFFAFVAYDTIEPIRERVLKLVNSGRRMTLIRHYHDSKSIDVSASLQVDTRAYDGGIRQWDDDEKRGFSIYLSRAILSGVGCWAVKSDGTEQDAADLYNNPRPLFRDRDATRVEVEGFGDGPNDHIRFSTINRNNVGIETNVYFEYEAPEDRAEREGAMLDSLAEMGDWPADRLRAIAERVRYDWESLAAIAAEVKDA